MAWLGDILEPFQLAAGCDFSLRVFKFNRLRKLIERSARAFFGGMAGAASSPTVLYDRGNLSFGSLLPDFGEAIVCPLQATSS